MGKKFENELLACVTLLPHLYIQREGMHTRVSMSLPVHGKYTL